MTRLESDLEREVVKWAEDLGGYALKLKDEERGWPDRTILLPDATIVFPELKRPKRQKRYHMQKLWIDRLQRLGFAADFCESMEDVANLVAEANV
jgi:hypothetical protein